MQTLSLREERFTVQVQGPADAPALIFSNSLGTRLDLWRAQAEALAQDFRVIRYDHRGYHPQSLAQGDFSIAQLAQDALAILDALQIERASWCGISLGGAVGLHAAAQHPTRIARLVVANAGRRFGNAADWQAKIDTARAQGVADWAAPTAARVLAPAFSQSHPEQLHWLSAQLQTAPGLAWAGCAAALRDADLSGYLPAIACPVLYIAGSEDLTVSVNEMEQMCAATPSAQIHTLAGAHLSCVDQAEAFNRLLRDFLQPLIRA